MLASAQGLLKMHSASLHLILPGRLANALWPRASELQSGSGSKMAWDDSGPQI